MSVSKKVLISTLMAAVCIALIVVTYKILDGEEVYSRTVTVEEGPLMSEFMKSWVQNHRNESKISAYAYKKDGVYELLLVDNRNGQKNQYLRTDVVSKNREGTLYIEYTDTNAVSEENVQYNKETYLILTEEPSLIKLTINGYESVLKPEIGNELITQP